ncbi:MAG: autotransporter domain-containing protein [Planctomycetaceae bacterium]|nr:autotransporter domain-containing protein [Planctomycetaceae bacterium]
MTSTISGSDTVFNTNAEFAGNVEFTDGATLQGGMRKITGNNTKTMLVDNTSLIDLSTSDLEVNGFKNVVLNGALRVGHDNADANKLILSNSTTLQGSISNSLELDSSFSKFYYGKDFSGTDVVVEGGITQQSQQKDWTISNAFGKFNFGYKNGDFALLKFETSDLSDVDEVRDNLNRNWSGNVISRGFASTIAEVAKTSIGDGDGDVVATSTAGQINFDILEAFAHGNSTFGTDSKTGVSGTLDRALLSMYNGSNQTGVVQVSVDVSKDIVNTLHSRLDAFRRYLVVIDPATGSEAALGNAILEDDRYFNRVWAGVLGSRMNADKRKGFEGYKYKGEGGIIGYDRGIGAGLIGFSAAYIKGDYEDKSSIAHDSDIENYAFDVYGTYNFSNGFFTTLNAGYTRSRNKINELRGDNWAREKYHTDSWRAGLKIGYDIMVSDTFFVSPSIGVDAYYARSNRHNANIDGQSLVEYGRMKTHGVEIPVDVKLSKDFVINSCSTVTLMANGGYAYNLHDKGIRGDLRVTGLEGANVGAYRAEGRKLGHHSWNAGAGVRFRYNEWEFAAKYDFYGRKGYTDHRVMGQVGFNF